MCSFTPLEVTMMRLNGSAVREKALPRGRVISPPTTRCDGCGRDECDARYLDVDMCYRCILSRMSYVYWLRETTTWKGIRAEGYNLTRQWQAVDDMFSPENRMSVR